EECRANVEALGGPKPTRQIQNSSFQKFLLTRASPARARRRRTPAASRCWCGGGAACARRARTRSTRRTAARGGDGVGARCGVGPARHRMKFYCDSCNAKYLIGDEKVSGKVLRIRCKKC